MSKRTPYLEIILTVAVMAFLALIIAGTFNQPSENLAQVTPRPR
jgi:TRAP-type C4-dicarboxylate transport system permease small subunit